MQIICYNCKNIWELSEAEIHDVRHKAGQGVENLTVTCPDCGARNVVIVEELIITDRTQSPVPAKGVKSMAEVDVKEYSVLKGTAAPAPLNPVEVPNTGIRRKGIIRVNGVKAHRDHSTWSEVMEKFNKGETVSILETWTDGESTWALLGPERWVNIEKDDVIISPAALEHTTCNE